jgi:hypothetical protein
VSVPTYIPRDQKLPWLQAVCVVLPQLPYLRKECLRKEYRNQRNLLAGFCYTASEAIYHLSEDEMQPWSLRFGPRDHQTHWFLKLAETGEIVDVTASQFGDMDAYAMYEYATRRGFLTKAPSKRAKAVLDRIDREEYWVQNGRRWSMQQADERYARAVTQRKAENSNPKV